MGMFAALDVTAAALDVQQLRLQIVASNLANAQTTRSADGDIFQPQVAILDSLGPARALGQSGLAKPVVSAIEPLDIAPRQVLNPGHPDADERGIVTYPGVDPVGWTLELMEISRHYEANLRAFDVTRSLMLRTLDVGRRQ